MAAIMAVRFPLLASIFWFSFSSAILLKLLFSSRAFCCTTFSCSRFSAKCFRTSASCDCKGDNPIIGGFTHKRYYRSKGVVKTRFDGLRLESNQQYKSGPKKKIETDTSQLIGFRSNKNIYSIIKYHSILIPLTQSVSHPEKPTWETTKF